MLTIKTVNVLPINRRQFIKTTSIISAGIATGPAAFAAATAPQATEDLICVFTKCLQFLDYDRLGETIAKAGFKGADLSVRKGGHVTPDNIGVDLPKAIRALEKAGLKVPMMVTDVNDPDDPMTEKVLSAASQVGITHYRMGYLNYDPAKTIRETLDMHKRTFEKLATINHKFKIHGEYQNHSGTRVGGPVWDIYWMLKDCDPAFIGSQYDIRHAVCEGGNSWPLGMKLLAPWIGTTDIKDFVWEKQNGKYKVEDVPLGEGMVDYDAYLDQYVKLGIKGPVSIHYEYPLGGAESGATKTTMPLEEISRHLVTDLAWLRKKFTEHGIDKT